MKKLNVFGLEVALNITNTQIDEHTAAEFDPVKKEIILDKRSPHLFLDYGHEVFHAFWYRLGMRQSRIPSSVEEILAENFSVFMEENIESMYKFYKMTKRKK